MPASLFVVVRLRRVPMDLLVRLDFARRMQAIRRVQRKILVGETVVLVVAVVEKKEGMKEEMKKVDLVEEMMEGVAEGVAEVAMRLPPRAKHPILLETTAHNPPKT